MLNNKQRKILVSALLPISSIGLLSVAIIPSITSCNKGGSSTPTVKVSPLKMNVATKSTLTLTKGDETVWLEYSSDNGARWTTVNAGTAISLTPGNYLLRGDLHSVGDIYPTNLKIIPSGTEAAGVTLSGSAMALLVEEDKTTQKSNMPMWCFYQLFKDSTAIIKIDESTTKFLPSTQLNKKCYVSMFEGCTNLTNAPELPATTLQNDCYCNMFKGCTKLTSVPALNAMNLAETCYEGMFQNCTSLVNAQVSLPATELKFQCYKSMFSGCTKLASAPKLPATKLDQNCYANMFEKCSSLTNAPELNSTNLAKSCYAAMFSGCTKLASAPKLPASVLANDCYDYMFAACTTLTTAPELNAMTLADSCYKSMFDGCTSLVNTQTSLPAIELKSECYKDMYQGCKALTKAPDLPAKKLVYCCYQQMFDGCGLTSAPIIGATELDTNSDTKADNCCFGMFDYCSSLKINNTGTTGTLFFTCPANISSCSSPVNTMFSNTGGSYKSDPVANGKYYFE